MVFKPMIMNTYFYPGEVVTLKQEIDKPLMIVKDVIKLHPSCSDKPVLLGVLCIWFSTDMKLQSAKFNTKDLIKL